jgi:hypothetical protein
MFHVLTRIFWGILDDGLDAKGEERTVVYIMYTVVLQWFPNVVIIERFVYKDLVFWP